MPFSPTLTPTGDATADLRAVRSTLGDAAQYALELRARPADQRDESYADDVRSAIDAITELDAIEQALAASIRTAPTTPEAAGGISAASTPQPSPPAAGTR